MKQMSKNYKLISLVVAIGLLLVSIPHRQVKAATYINWIAQVPENPVAGQTVRVWMNSDTSSIEKAAVEYRKNGEAIDNFLGTLDTSYPGANWYLDIPANPAGTVVEYALAFWDPEGGIRLSGVTKSYTVAAAPVETPCSATCFVNDISGLDTNPGNVTSPFKTIQQAIDAVSVGGTVHVRAGTYANSGAIALNKAGVTIHLEAGAIIQNTSACFAVSANNIHIYADSPAAAKCVPTGSSNGINVSSGVESLRVVNLEFDGAAGTDGILFAGAITNFQIINNYFHGFTGDAIEFSSAPAESVKDIQGNYFLGNGGQGVKVPTGASVNATYNSWGTYVAPSLAGVTTSPNTHAELFVTPAVGGEVLKDNNVVFTVKGKIQNLTGAQFELIYPETYLKLEGAITNTTTWDQLAKVDTSVAGKVKVGLSAKNTVYGESIDMLTLTFKALAYADNLTLTFSETADSFAMNPLPLPNYSNFVYTHAQNGVSNLDIVGPSSLTVTLAAGPYYVGTAIPVEVKIDNTNGGTYSGLTLVFSLPSGAVLEYNNGTAWVSASSPFTVGNLDPDQIRTMQFQVTLSTLGNNDIAVALKNGATAVDSDSATVAIEGNFNVLGTFAMQGRTVRGGIPVNFKLGSYEPPTVLSIDQLVYNLTAILLYNGSYTITTNQPRYLNVTAALAKTVVVPRALPLTALTLRGGNVTDNESSLNKVDLADATMMGLAFGSTGDPLEMPADANFDGMVSVQDLAIVSGNLDLTSTDVYASWEP